jgi:acyl CoA:acetate/3-ketoacid CoA transferase
MAQAAKNSGGKVIVQVEKVVEYGCLDSRMVRIPGIYVDAVVMQNRKTICRPLALSTIRHIPEKQEFH